MNRHSLYYPSCIRLLPTFFVAMLILCWSTAVVASSSASSVSQAGITWVFDREYEIGQYITGDYYVVGPVIVKSITRPSNDTGRDGSMVNPIPSQNHGYDSRVGGYQASLNVANSLPLLLNPGASLISTISRNPTETERSKRRPALEVGAILTVVESRPPAGAFRPPYTGTRKPQHFLGNVDTTRLLNLPPVPSATSGLIASAKSWHHLPWLDHVLEWQGDDLHPRQNMPNYGRDLAARVHDSALLLMMDIPADDKQEILVNFIQVGIDFHENVVSGAHWGFVGGGIGVGRKLPGLLAGVLLQNKEMMNFSINNDPRHHFQEDSQIEPLTQEARDRTYKGGDNPGYFDDIALGTPVWIERGLNWRSTGWVHVPGKLSYMVCCTTNATHGAALVVRLMGLENLWNYDPWLDFVDSYMGDDFYGRANQTEGYHRSWTALAAQMWDTYRLGSGGTLRPPKPPALMID
jgi:hypothetical protein